MSKRNSDLLEPQKDEICPTSYFVLGIEIYEMDKNQKKAKPIQSIPSFQVKRMLSRFQKSARARDVNMRSF